MQKQDRTCSVCKETTPDNKATRTHDSHDICLKCYVEAAHEMRSSTVTLAQAKDCHKLFKRYEAKLGKFFRGIQVLAKRTGKTPRAALSEMLIVEQQVSEERFAKDWTCTFKGEHIEAMDEVMRTFGLDKIRGELAEEVQSTSRGKDTIREVRKWYKKQHVAAETYPVIRKKDSWKEPSAAMRVS